MHVPEHIDELIARVLSGEAGRADHDALRIWMNKSPEHRRYFEQLEEAYFMSPQHVEVDVDAAWQKVQSQLAETKEVKVLALRSNRYYWYAAAGIAALLGSWFFFFRTTDNRQLAATNQIIIEKLPDGSSVTIQKGSELEYHTDPRGRRKALLKGTAFFEVKHMADHPFTIDAGGVLIEDIGTAFNVNAPENADSITVYVTEGIVQLHAAKEEGITLHAGEGGRYIRSRKVYEKIDNAIDENEAAWKDKQFKFNNTRLDKVVRKLNEVYAGQIRLGSDLISGCRITASFENEDLDTIVQIIADTFGIEATKTGSDWLLTGEGCGDQTTEQEPRAQN